MSNHNVQDAENKFETSKLKPVNITDPESFKVRKGKVGGYTDYLSQEDIAFIDKEIKEKGIDFVKFYGVD